jgi:hypothetical protein
VNQLTQAAEALGIPILLTEQYGKGFGKTIPEVDELAARRTRLIQGWAKYFDSQRGGAGASTILLFPPQKAASLGEWKGL